MSMSLSMSCSLCGRPIEEPRRAWKQMVGWVSPKGAKSMTGAKPTGAFAHDTCIVRIKAGFEVEQQALWTE